MSSDKPTDQEPRDSNPLGNSLQVLPSSGRTETLPELSGFRPDVVAGKYDPSLFDETGENLLVNEVFYSLQGEGVHSGKATVFVRLAKCNLACKFCDTEFETYEKVAARKVYEQVLLMSFPPGRWRENPQDAPLVDLTGGEPALQNCGKLIDALHIGQFKVGIETSGSVWAEWLTRLDHITVSPKVPLNRIPQQLRERASEFKWVVNAAFLNMYERHPNDLHVAGVPNYLQPESNNPKWTAAAMKLILRHPSKYQLSLQLHKVIGAQ